MYDKNNELHLHFPLNFSIALYYTKCYCYHSLLITKTRTLLSAEKRKESTVDFHMYNKKRPVCSSVSKVIYIGRLITYKRRVSQVITGSFKIGNSLYTTFSQHGNVYFLDLGEMISVHCIITHEKNGRYPILRTT